MKPYATSFPFFTGSALGPANHYKSRSVPRMLFDQV